MPDVTTSLNALLKRAASKSVDGIAKEGLKSLKSVLDSSGFASSPYLKNYEVFAHVTGGKVTFEIKLNADAVKPADVTAEKDMKQQQETQNNLNEIKDIASRKYGLTERGTQKIYNDSRRNALKSTKSALKAQKSALKPTKSGTKVAEERLIGHEIAYHAPRSMDLTKDGKLAISFRRSIRQTASSDFHYPKGKFSGIPDKFMKNLQKVVMSKFQPHLVKIMKGKT
jgi:hypothetical protein